MAGNLMITLPGIRQSPFCDGLSRRNFLKAGALGFGGLTMANLLRAEASALKEAVADLTLENRLLKKSMLGAGGDDE